MFAGTSEGSLGIPRVPWLERVGLQSTRMKAFQFYDTTINEHVENAFHALCLDEKRAAFSPALWEKHRNSTTVRPVHKAHFDRVNSTDYLGYRISNKCGFLAYTLTVSYFRVLDSSAWPV